ncbi:hypothetical protein [Iodobacter fluviatilis]|uniref:Uncharacterized protein n=1 Tax=Iodobacter fluviatilis TaxID=537 RepID=A0A377Q5I2_9NEIS|nr:hypothetical protein [Iodobacter fluviatilis]TCU84552.1 hypothetical protein EV682_10977 [Iodobacter fluviatilis]STQ90018.1 Uncharacterised protein [Iodobacter fluviatilis]
MTFEIFKQVDKDGDDVVFGDHLITGRKTDFIYLASWLNEGYEANRRVKSVLVLSEKFKVAADTLSPLVRLDVKEARSLVDVLGHLAEGKAKSAKVYKVSLLFSNSLSIW